MKKRLGAIPKGLEWISESLAEDKQSATTSVKTHFDYAIPASKRGLQADLIRATFILKQDYLDKIKSYAYWERIQIKDVFDDMCEQFFQDKKIRSIPEKKK